MLHYNIEVKLRTFEKYFEYVKKSFSMYEKISVDIKVQNNDTLIISIFPHSNKSHGIRGSLYFKFDQETVGFFGDFLPDDYIDWFDNSWEKYSEKEILEFLDKKIEEYKNYIDNGYFFAFYNMDDKRERLWAYVYTGDFNKIEYKTVYLDQKPSDRADYSQIKSVTVTNFYGDIIVENKILN